MENFLINKNKGEFDIPLVATKLESFFISDHPDLLKMLSLFSYQSLIELLSSIELFFKGKFNLSTLTKEEIENLDFKALAYDFAGRLQIEKQIFTDELTKEKVIIIYSKLGRLFLHEILFPELLKIDQQLAINVKNILKRTIGGIAIIENINKHELYDLLQIEELPVGNNYQLREGNNSENGIKKTSPSIYFKTIINEVKIAKLAKIFKSEYGIIYSTSEFTQLFCSNGSCSKPLRVKKTKIKTFLLAIHILYNEKEGSKRLINLNRGKGYWDCLQINVVDENEHFFDREFEKICSEIKNIQSEEHTAIKKEVDQILIEFIIK